MTEEQQRIHLLVHGDTAKEAARAIYQSAVGMEGWGGDVHLDRDFCTALPRFLFVLISGILKANENL